MTGSAHDGDPVDLSQVEWCISSRSGDGTGRIALRHSQHPDGPVIIYTRAEWDAFLTGAKDNEFDFPA